MPEETYHQGIGHRLINPVMRALIRLGVAPRRYYVLTVRGRKSGRLYSTPVSLIVEGDRRWLVAPYGPVSWVVNARAAGKVTLSRRGHAETVPIIELGPEESAPVLKQYLANEPITQPYFEAAPDAPLEAFAQEAARHPVFQIGQPG